MTAGAIAVIVIAVFVIVVAARTIRIVPQARAGVVERLGRYSRTLSPGLAIVVPDFAYPFASAIDTKIVGIALRFTSRSI